VKAAAPGVVECSPVLLMATLATTESRGVRGAQPCQVVAIDARLEAAVNDFQRCLHFGGDASLPSTLLAPATPDEPFTLPPDEARLAERLRRGKRGVVVGSTLLRRLGLLPGRRIRLYTLHENEQGEARAASETFLITGAYSSGDTETERALVFMDRRDALSFFREMVTTTVDELRIRIDDPARASEVQGALLEAKSALIAESRLRPDGDPYLEVFTWIDVHRTFLAAVENERSLLLVISSFSFIVVAFLIGATQSMLVIEKTREIGVLRSLGASVAGTSAIFLGNGVVIGAAGAGAGTALGVAIATHVQDIADWLRATFGLDLFPQEIYRFTEVPVEVRPGFAAVVCAGAILFAVLGALIPALRAASLDPVESLHHE
jgi:lipoprotein-releasing system permease protein